MEILLAVAKYTGLGILVFLGATIITKTISKYADKFQEKDDNDTQ